MSNKVEFQTRNIRLTEKIEEYVSKKAGNFDHYLPTIEEARVELSHYKAARNATDVVVRKQYQLAPYHDYLSLALSGLVLATMLWFLHLNALPSAWNHPVYGLLLTGIWELTLFFVHRRRILVWPKD